MFKFDREGYFDKYKIERDIPEVNKRIEKEYGFKKGVNYSKYEELFGSLIRGDKVNIKTLKFLCEKLELGIDEYGTNIKDILFVLKEGGCTKNGVISESILTKLKDVEFIGPKTESILKEINQRNIEKYKLNPKLVNFVQETKYVDSLIIVDKPIDMDSLNDDIV